MSSYEQIVAATALATLISGAGMCGVLAAPALKAGQRCGRRRLAAGGAALGVGGFCTAFAVASIAWPGPSINPAPGLALAAGVLVTLLFAAALLPAPRKPRRTAMVLGLMAVLSVHLASLAAGGASPVLARPGQSLLMAGVAAGCSLAALHLVGRGGDAWRHVAGVVALAAGFLAPLGLFGAAQGGSLVDPFVMVVACGGLALIQLGWLGAWLSRRWLAGGSRLERMELIADAAEEGLVLCDGRRIVLANGTLARLAGRTAEDLADRDIGTVLFGPDGVNSLPIPAEGVRRGMVWTRAGEGVEVDIVARPLADDNGRLILQVRPSAPAVDQAASSEDASAAAARTLRSRIARSAASPVNAS